MIVQEADETDSCKGMYKLCIYAIHELGGILTTEIPCSVGIVVGLPSHVQDLRRQRHRMPTDGNLLQVNAAVVENLREIPGGRME